MLQSRRSVARSPVANRLRGGSSSVAERLTVAQDVVGSIPTRRPINCFKIDNLQFHAGNSIQAATHAKVRERCRSFLRSCYECKWLERVPPLPKITVDEPPTMPLTADLLDAFHVATI
jgi:hypothetical protein